MKKVRIGEVATITRGVSYKKEQASKEKKTAHELLLRANNINAGQFNFDDLVFVSSDLIADDQHIKAGDIVITMSSGSKAHVGKVALARSDMNCTFGAFCAKITAENVFAPYLFYALRGSAFRKHIETQCKGTNINNIKQSYILDFEIPLPPLPEQQRIVARIEELFSQLDSCVETLRKTKQQLAVYRQAVLKEAFVGNYPEKSLRSISKAISGYAFKSKRYSPDGKYTVVKIGNVKPFHFDFARDLTRTNEADETILDKCLLQYGDCLITQTGTRGRRDYGYVAMITDEENYLLNQRVAALRFDKRIANPRFFQYYLSSPKYRNDFFAYETGNVGQGNVGIKALQEPRVIVPSIEEQNRIVEKLESQLSVCDSIEQTVDAALQQAEALRQSILKKAFEGGI